MSQLHKDGWLRLEDGMPEWELVAFVERLHLRYRRRLLELLEEHREDWLKPDEEDSGPGAHRPGGLVASRATEALQGTGVYVYAAHPSQADDEEDEDSYAGPRWYVSCMEAAMRHYGTRGMAPPPPADLQDLLWPDERDRCRPWLTELGWTVVPESSQPQVVHADICSCEDRHPRKPHRGRYHHFAWKLNRSERCTTNVVPRGFTEGAVEAHHYDEFLTVRAPALIFDSEMLHRGGATSAGSGWTSTLTLQVCSGTGWPHLSERVSESLMWYTQPLGWVSGDAVDACVRGSWEPALVESRDHSGRYSVTLASEGVCVGGLRDRDLRYRQPRPECLPKGGPAAFALGEVLEARFEGEWHEAKVTRCNADGTYRVRWRRECSCTDGVEPADLRKLSGLSDEGGRRPGKRKRCSEAEGEESEDKMLALRATLFRRGLIQFSHGLPASWRWALFDFVEHYYDLFNDLVIRELDALRAVWTPCEGSQQRHGAFAAAKVSERLRKYGLAIYSPANSQCEKPPYESTGPRWYVSVTAAALEHFGPAAPPPPPELHKALFSHPADSADELRARGIGWALAPPGSDPQCVHADLWGVDKHARTDRTRWPHILWKRSRTECCTTQLVPGAFTQGEVLAGHFEAIAQVCAPAVVLDSEMLHRGAATPPAPAGSRGTDFWKSSLSLELCSPSGWAAWEEYGTGGTIKDPTSALDWRMLRIRKPSPGASLEASLDPAAERLIAETPTLPAAPWSSVEELKGEQRQWELFS